MHPFVMIGERINPGFAGSRVLFETQDIAGIQRLAKRQADAGASCLNVNAGERAMTDPRFLVEIIRAIQQVVDIPLSFDFPRLDVQEICLDAYDRERARGGKPIINSISEGRPELLELLRIAPCRVMIMASERMEDGEVVANHSAREVHATAARVSKQLRDVHGLQNEDMFVDVSLATFAADDHGRTHTALGAIGLVRADPGMRHIHIMGGLTNIGLMLPPREFDGVKLQHAIERAFVTLALPLGLDTVLATPWLDYSPLPEGHPVLAAFRELIELEGLEFLHRLRRFLRPSGTA